MDNRVLELARQAGFYVVDGAVFVPTTDENITTNIQKFAELIIQERCLVDVQQAVTER